MAKWKMPTVPQLIYDSFEMDQVERPSDYETMEAFADRLETAEFEGNLGDTLVLFVVRELNDPYEDYEELMARMDRAAKQMMTFSVRLQHFADYQEENQ